MLAGDQQGMPALDIDFYNNQVGMWNVDSLHCEFYPHPVWIWKKLAAVCISQTKYGSYGVAGEILSYFHRPLFSQTPISKCCLGIFNVKIILYFYKLKH